MVERKCKSEKSVFCKAILYINLGKSKFFNYKIQNRFFLIFI